MKRDRALITGEEMKLIETILDYPDRHTQEACFGWMTEMLDECPDMASSVVPRRLKNNGKAQRRTQTIQVVATAESRHRFDPLNAPDVHPTP